MIPIGFLSDGASEVVRAGRSALRATSADRNRVETALRARLGSVALPFDALTPRALVAGWHFAPGAAICLCLAGGALFFALQSRTSAEPAVTPLVTAAVALTPPNAAPRAAAAASESAEATAPSPNATSRSASVTSPRQDRLAQEVALLVRATSALGDGRASEALSALNEHQQRFPDGILSEERRAAKAQALCSLGRISEGRVELAHLTPGSPSAGRAQQACDSVMAKQ